MKPPDTPKMLETPNSLSPAVSPHSITMGAENPKSIGIDAEFKPFVGCYKCGALDHQATNRNCPRPRKAIVTTTKPSLIKKHPQKKGEEKRVKKAKKGEQTRYWYYESEDSEDGGTRIRIKHEHDCDTTIATAPTSSPEAVVNISPMAESARKGMSGNKLSPKIAKKSIVQKKVPAQGGPRSIVHMKKQQTPKASLKNFIPEKPSSGTKSRKPTPLDDTSDDKQKFFEYQLYSRDLPDTVIDGVTEDVFFQPLLTHNEDPSSPLRGRQTLRENPSLNVGGLDMPQHGVKEPGRPLAKTMDLQEIPLPSSVPQPVESLVLTKEYIEFLDAPENDPFSSIHRVKNDFNYIGVRNDICAPGRVRYGGRSYQGWRECRTVNGEGVSSMLW